MFDKLDRKGTAMKYAIRDANGEIVTIVDADNLAEAVSVKHDIQAHHNNMHACDEVFSVGLATRAERRAFKPVGFIAIKRPGR
jgi:hypothetical protein